MTDVLTGQNLTWGVCDHEGVVAAALHDMLEQLLRDKGVRPRMWLSESPQQMEQLCHTYQLGLAVWVLASEAHLAEVCSAIMAVRDKHHATLCLCVLNASRGDWYGLLGEAGAQLIVSDLPTLQTALPRLVDSAPLSAPGTHPLTTGLLERLPWGHL